MSLIEQATVVSDYRQGIMVQLEPTLSPSDQHCMPLEVQDSQWVRLFETVTSSYYKRLPKYQRYLSHFDEEKKVVHSLALALFPTLTPFG